MGSSLEGALERNGGPTAQKKGGSLCRGAKPSASADMRVRVRSDLPMFPR